jgi:hypothetical protein
MANIRLEDLGKTLQDRIDKKADKAKKLWLSTSCPLLETLLNTYYDNGISPVENGEKFKKYSKSYKKQRQSLGLSSSPVQMKKTGEMRDSLKVVPREKSISIYFSGKRNKELAYIHSVLGAGKAQVVRKLLPFFKDERFNKTIRKALSDLFHAIYKRIKL